METRLIHWILHHRFIVLVLLILLTIGFGGFAAGIRFDNTIETYFMESDLHRYNRFLGAFGTDEIIAIGYRGQDPFSEPGLRLIDTLTVALERMPHVRRVLSLTNVKTVYNEEGMVRFKPLIQDYPLSLVEKQKIKKIAFRDPFIPGTVISRDGKKTAVIAEIDHLVGKFDYKVALLKDIRALIRRLSANTHVHFSLGGGAVLDDALFRYNQRDQALFIPLMMLIVVTIIYLMFRRLQFVLLPLIVVILSVIWTYGSMKILGYKINIISAIIPVLLMGVAIADSMHLIAEYLNEATLGNREKPITITHAFANILSPCFMTSLTTVLGLVSLVSADLIPIRQFGLVASLGVVFAFLLTITLLPVLLLWMPYPKERYRRQYREGMVSRILDHLGRWQKGRATGILILTTIFAVPGFFLLTRLEIGTNSMDYFRKDDTIRRQVEWIDGNIGGTTSLEFLVETGQEDALKNPTFLQKMVNFQEYLKTLNGITGVYSVTDMVRTLHRAFQGGADSYFVIPKSRAAVSQELLLVEGSEDLQELVTGDYSQGRITARVEMNQSEELSRRMPEIERRMVEIFGDSVSVFPTGIVFLMHRMEDYLLHSQVRSFLLAFTIVFLAIFLMLRSIPLGLLAIIPNILPIMMTLALMPLFHIPLDVGTVMIGAVAIGLVVDDSIHFLSRFQLEISHGFPLVDAIAAAMKASGRPIIFTSVVLSLGFLVLVGASFNPIVHFGILLFVLVLLALLFDLVVLPALLGFVIPDRYGNQSPPQHLEKVGKKP